MIKHLLDNNFNTLILNDLCAKHAINPENTRLIKEDSNLNQLPVILN